MTDDGCVALDKREFGRLRAYLGPKKRRSGSSLRELLAQYPWEMLSGAGIVLAGTSAFHLTFIYVPIYAMRQLGIGVGVVQMTTITAAIVCGLLILLAGHLSDRIGRRAPSCCRRRSCRRLSAIRCLQT